jgi:phenylpyruvate tautomerase PptA (4-oxalocrotonate tautomerase family)
MPMILIEVANKYTNEQEIALMNEVSSALRKTFKVSLEAINTRLLVHELHRFSVPIHCNPEQYVLISIDCFSGRSLTTKRDLYHAIVENLNGLGIPKDHVKIVLRESVRENWGILGGFAGCDVDVGYKVEV